MTDRAGLDYEEWVENVAQSISILLTCMRVEDRDRILERVHAIGHEHDAARRKREDTQQVEAQGSLDPYQQQERIAQEQSQQAQ